VKAKVLGIVVALLALLALLIAGCGGDSDSSDTISYRPYDIFVKKRERQPEDLKPGPNGLAGSELKPVIPDRPPPDFLYLTELIDSFSPAVASDGDRVTLQYVGFLYDSKEKFVSSWDEGKPFTFTLGKGEVIPGWEEGLQRLEIGDRRQMIVPPDLATDGSRMRGMPTGSTLVFVVEALDVDERE
jgi:peptidylprolyl isomerase